MIQRNSRPVAYAAYVAFLFLPLVLFASCGRPADADTLTILIEKRVPSLDPRVSADSAAERLRQLLFNGLTRKNERFEPVPDLATSISLSEDKRVHTFKLREGVKFHDGRALTSGDVKYTFETMMDKGFQSQKKAEVAQILSSIEAPDPQTVVFTCHTPCPSLPNIIVPIGIIPQGSSSTQATKPVGTGPFSFEYYIDDQEVGLVAFPGYFDGKPLVGKIHLRISPDSSTRESELRKGSVDLAINADLDPISVESLRKVAGLKVETADGTNLSHMGVNLLDPVLKDRRVRQAIAYAIDRDAIIRDILRGQAQPAQSILPVGVWAFEPASTNYRFDPERAVKLLDEAGRKSIGGAPRLKLSLKTSTVAITRKVGEAIQEQLRKINVEIDLQPLERQKLTQDMVDGNFQLYLNTLVGGNQSPDVFRYAYASKSIPPNGQNRSRYSNAVVDRLLDEAVLASSDRQKAIFSEIQKTLAEDLPQIYLWYPATVVIHRDRVSALNLDPSGDWRALRSVKLEP
ncbi:MAG: ABC transporter substrate-binding protein [Acidobacteriota bacterium]